MPDFQLLLFTFHLNFCFSVMGIMQYFYEKDTTKQVTEKTVTDNYNG